MTARLADLVAADGLFVDGDWVETKDQDVSGAVRLTQLSDVGEAVWRDRSNRRMTTLSADRMGCTYLLPGDVLIARMPDPLGRSCQFPGDRLPCVTCVDVAILRPGTRSVNSRWLMWWLNTPQVRQQVDSHATGTTRRRISRRNLKQLRLPLPPVPEQRRIVNALETHISSLDAGLASAEAAKRRQHGLRRRIIS